MEDGGSLHPLAPVLLPLPALVHPAAQVRDLAGQCRVAGLLVLQARIPR